MAQANRRCSLRRRPFTPRQQQRERYRRQRPARCRIFRMPGGKDSSKVTHHSTCRPGTTERQIGAESTFNPNAVNSSGARGLAQIMPGTQPDVEKAIGRSINPFNPFDAMDGHDFVMRRAMNSRQGNIVQSLLDYGGFRKDNRYSDSARDYLTKILGEHWIMYDHPESPVPR